MKMNRVELEMQRLRESTGENYMLNKMVNYNDSNGVYVEYTLYKDYNKYFGLTLEGDTFDVVDIMEEEFAEFLSHYRLSTLYNKRKEENWDISPEENEKIKEAITKSKVSNFKPVYDKNDIGDEIEVGSKIVSEQTLRDIQRAEMKSAQLEADHDNGSDYDIDESTVSGICVNNPSMWFTSNTAEPNGTLTRTESNKVYKGGVDLGDLSDLIHTVVSEVVETLLKEGSCSIDINLNKN